MLYGVGVCAWFEALLTRAAISFNPSCKEEPQQDAAPRFR